MNKDHYLANVHKRMGALEKLGFNCLHMDSNVTHESVPGVTFDFSATDERFFVSEALSIVSDQAFKDGANILRHKLSELLRIED